MDWEAGALRDTLPELWGLWCLLAVALLLGDVVINKAPLPSAIGRLELAFQLTIFLAC